MRKLLALLSLLVTLAIATRAHALGGVFLRWDACYGDGGAPNQTFACNTNTGSQMLVGGFELGADLPFASGNTIVIDLASASSTLPAWWQMRNVGTCRQMALSINFAISPSASGCVDWAQGQAVGGIGAYNLGQRGPNTIRIVAQSGVSPDARQDLPAGQEYFSFNLVISNVKTVGAGACAGCSTPVCLVLRSVNVTTPVPANVRLVGPANGVDSDMVTWQGGGGANCLFPTPTVGRTWGAVKALYR